MTGFLAVLWRSCTMSGIGIGRHRCLRFFKSACARDEFTAVIVLAMAKDFDIRCPKALPKSLHC
jgi:hypothetical protein